MSTTTQQGRLNRKSRIRKKVGGTGERPRLSVYKSVKHIYAQVIDDERGVTLAHASDLDVGLREELKAAKAKKSEVAAKVGALIAKKCAAAQIEKIVFDRNGFPYHGRISAVADGARKAGLKF